MATKLLTDETRNTELNDIIRNLKAQYCLDVTLDVTRDTTNYIRVKLNFYTATRMHVGQVELSCTPAGLGMFWDCGSSMSINWIEAVSKALRGITS